MVNGVRETAWNVVESVERAWSVVPVVGATLAEGSSVDSAQQRQSRLPRTTTQHPSETRSGKARDKTHRTLVMVTVPACFVSSRQCDERSRWSSRYVRPYVCVGRSRHSNRRRLVVLSSLLLRRVSQNSLLLSAHSLARSMSNAARELRQTVAARLLESMPPPAAPPKKRFPQHPKKKIALRKAQSPNQRPKVPRDLSGALPVPFPDVFPSQSTRESSAANLHSVAIRPQQELSTMTLVSDASSSSPVRTVTFHETSSDVSQQQVEEKVSIEEESPTVSSLTEEQSQRQDIRIPASSQQETLHVASSAASLEPTNNRSDARDSSTVLLQRSESNEPPESVTGEANASGDQRRVEHPKKPGRTRKVLDKPLETTALLPWRTEETSSTREEEDSQRGRNATDRHSETLPVRRSTTSMETKMGNAKDPNPSTGQSRNEVNNNNEKAKRKVGRPKKVDGDENLTNATEPESLQPKRPVGRPRKVLAPEDDKKVGSHKGVEGNKKVGSQKVVEGNKAETEKHSQEKTPVEPQTKRPVGRPRKEAVEQSPRKQVGRPKKVESPKEAVVEKRPVGRPRKSHVRDTTETVGRSKKRLSSSPSRHAGSSDGASPKRSVGRPRGSGKTKKRKPGAKRNELGSLLEGFDHHRRLAKPSGEREGRLYRKVYELSPDEKVAKVQRVTVGTRVAVFWAGDREYFAGTISGMRTLFHKKPFFLSYDDGDDEWLDLADHEFHILERNDPDNKNFDTHSVRGKDAFEEFVLGQLNTPEHVMETDDSDSGGADDEDADDEATPSVAEEKPREKASSAESEEPRRRKSSPWSRQSIDSASRGVTSPKPMKGLFEDTDDSGEENEFEPDGSPSSLQVIEVPKTDGLKVGIRVGVWWDDDETYYNGTLARVLKGNKKPHYVEYDDGESEWINLATMTYRILTEKAVKDGRRKATDDRRKVVDKKRRRDEDGDEQKSPDAAVRADRSKAAGKKRSRDEGTDEQAPPDAKRRKKLKIGQRVGIWWDGDGKFYKGRITREREGKKSYYVHYDDDEGEWICAEKETIKIYREKTSDSARAN